MNAAVDFYYTIEGADRNTAELLGVKLDADARTIYAEKEGRMPVTIHYLKTDGTTATTTMNIAYVPFCEPVHPLSIASSGVSPIIFPDVYNFLDHQDGFPYPLLFPQCLQFTDNLFIAGPVPVPILVIIRSYDPYQILTKPYFLLLPIFTSGIQISQNDFNILNLKWNTYLFRR